MVPHSYAALQAEHGSAKDELTELQGRMTAGGALNHKLAHELETIKAQGSGACASRVVLA